MAPLFSRPATAAFSRGPAGPYRILASPRTDYILPQRGLPLLFCGQCFLNCGSIDAEHLSRWTLPGPRLFRLPGEGP